MREQQPAYHNAPVPPFGDRSGRLIIVGLAPGTHGANATGRPFTGDFAGILLYTTLHALGAASQPVATDVDDGLTLSGCWITNAVKCLPPENKPTTGEIDTCNTYLIHELGCAAQHPVILALGTIAHRAVLKALGYRQSAFRFGHGAEYELEGYGTLIDSYHCSRYNTQTGRLTESMFRRVLSRALELSGD